MKGVLSHTRDFSGSLCTEGPIGGILFVNYLLKWPIEG